MRLSLAAHDLPDGRAYYDAKIREYTTLDMDPDAIHALGGIGGRAAARARWSTPMKQTGFKGDFPSFLVFLRTDARISG